VCCEQRLIGKIKVLPGELARVAVRMLRFNSGAI